MWSAATSRPGKASAAKTARAHRWGAARRRSASPRSPSEAPVPELGSLVHAAIEAAEDDEQVEAYAEEGRQTEVSALRSQIEGMTFAESRGLGVRVIRDGRLGYAWAADPSEDEARGTVWRARENAALSEPDEHNALPDPQASESMPEIFREPSGIVSADDKVPVVLDPFAASSFLGVLAGALNAENVLKGRSLFADMVGRAVGSDPFTLVDDGRRLDGPGACPFDAEGVPSGRTELFTEGTLQGFLHDTYTARRAGDGQRSTGNAKRGGYRSTPGVGTSNFFVDPGDLSYDQLLARAEGGVLIMDVSGVHSGANPISGEFSVGATGLRVEGGSAGEPLREMTIASTLPEMLSDVAGVGSDLRFFSSVGTPSILIGEMTLAGV